MDGRKGASSAQPTAVGGSGTLTGTLIPAVLTLLLYAAIVGASAFAIVQVQEVSRYNAIQDERLFQFTEQHERDLDVLRATDASNLALVEGEILVLVNRVNDCCLANNSDGGYNDTALLVRFSEIQSNFTALQMYIETARDAFRQNFTNFFDMVNMYLFDHNAGDLKHLNGLQADANNNLNLVGVGCTVVQNGTDPYTLVINTTCLSLQLFEDEKAQRQLNDTNLLAQILQESATRAAKDMTLMGNVSSLRDVSILTINGLPATTNNIQIEGVKGIRVTNASSTVSLENTGVLSINSRPSDATSGDSLLSGAGMITIDPGALPHENVVNGTVLATAINNLDMTVSVHSMHLMNLTATDINLQTQITALNVSGTIISLITNDNSFNVTIMSILNNLTMLQSQVSVLEAQVANLTAIAVVTGSMLPWSGTPASVPSSYLYCDGAQYSQATYPALYAVVGCQYCAGMTCSMSNFCVPDLRGRVPVGQGGSAFMTRGASVGAETHTLTTTEMPTHSHTMDSAGAHSHPGSTTFNAGGHYHDLKLGNGCANSFGSGLQTQFRGATLMQVNSGSGQATIRITEDQIPTGGANPTSCVDHPSPNTDYIQFAAGAKTAGDHFHNLGLTTDGGHAHTINSAGSGGAHNNIQPSVVVGGYMIKT